MKFGKNLIELSIPEWESYNLDYNELKGEIKKVINHETSLNSLTVRFIENFNVINLFLSTKYGEIFRKHRYFETTFNDIVASEENVNIKLLKYDLIISNLVELSLILKKLSKFILIQKIAVKKIFKKFVKKFPNKEVSNKFILQLKLNLNKNQNSFINFNLLDLTVKITNLINLIKYEINKLNNKEDSENELGPVDSEISPNLAFDFNAFVKTNFQMSFLLPDDTNNFNEILLNLNIYMELRNINNHQTINSTIFLQNDNNLIDCPSYIISEKGQPKLLVISYIGGLRKYSYCYLDTEIVELLLSYIADPENHQVKNDLTDYFHTSAISSLTKLTIESILNNNLKPKCKCYYKSLRYVMDKGYGVDIPHQDDYMLALRYDIFTTNMEEHIYSVEFKEEDPTLDNFPFNLLLLNSNDSHLLSFEKSVLSEIKDKILTIKFSTTLLNKLPPKVQKLIKNNNSINLFKDFNMYHYLLSCYYNLIPTNINNHFSNLLTLNLLKNFEDVTKFNIDLNLDDDLIKSNSDHIVKKQMSLTDLQYQTQQLQQQVQQKRKYRPVLSKNASLQSFASSFDLSVFTNDRSRNNDIDELIDNEDNESLKMFWNDDPELSKRSSYSNLGFISNLIGGRSANISPFRTDYNSINSANSSDYHETLNQYYYEHDKIISFFYLTLSFSSLFISAVELGILFSILKLSQSSQFKMINNIWLFLILVAGIIISLTCSILSLNLMFKRFSRYHNLHMYIVGFSFALISLSIVFNSFMIFI